MNVTKELIKKESANFDLECIFQLDLAGKGISNLGSLNECTNLEILNLSFNDISSLILLKPLIRLQYLNLSCNRISNLDGLQCLEQLRSLNLAGNLINSLKTLEVLQTLQNLTHLKLNDAKNGYTNPICHNLSYKTDVRAILPNLTQLDDDAGKSNIFEAFENASKQQELDKESYASFSKNIKWTSEDFFVVKPLDETIIEKAASLELDKFSSSCSKAQEFLNDTQQYLNNLRSQFHV